MPMALSLLALIALAVVGLVVVGGIVAVVVLFSNRKTQTTGAALLLIGLGVFVFLGFVALFGIRMHSSKRTAVISVPQGSMVTLKPPAQSPNQDIALKVKASTTDDGQTKIEVTDEAGSNKLLPALAKALAKAIAETKKQPAEPVKPADTAPIEKPEWVDVPPGPVDGVYQTTVTVGPYTTRQECDDALPRELSRATADYVETYLDTRAGRRVSLSPEFLREHVVKAEWEEPIQASVGPMIQVHALLKYDGPVNARLKEEWRRTIISSRIMYAGAGLLAVMGALLALFAFLKIDLITKGAYRGRLKLAALAGILILVVGVLLLTA